jgi:glycosyltransferase involved in cell wall biosynthesis
MKIFIVEPRGSGGMVHYAYQLCNALSSCGAEVTLVTAKKYELDGYPHSFQTRKLLDLWGSYDLQSMAPISYRGAQLWWRVYRNIRRVFRGARLFFEWIKLVLYLLKERPDIVQFGEIEFPFEAIFLHYLKSRGLILAQICHEFEPRERADSFFVRLNNRLLLNVFRAFSVLFFHSPSNVNRFRELYPDIPAERFLIIPLGNEQIFHMDGDPAQTRDALMDRYHITNAEKIVLFFGNLTPSKGVADLLCAFEKVHAQNRFTRLVIAGMPSKYIDVNALLAMASNLGIQSATTFDTRYLPMGDVGPLMDLATVVVYPYISSTQSASIQVAYTFGKPVIATRVGGLPDVVVDGESGFLVDPHSPEQLATAIMTLINDPILAGKMGRYAKGLSETRFAWGPIAGNIVMVYKNLLSENSSVVLR